MEFVTLLLIIAILILLLNFKDKTANKLNELENNLLNIKAKLSKLQAEEKIIKPAKAEPELIVEPVAAIVPEPEPPQSDNYWETGFKVIGEAEQIISTENETVVTPQEEAIPKAVEATDPIITTPQQPQEQSSKPTFAPPPPKPGFFERNPDLEKFIGENLISKIGIGILVLAIGYFVKFAIDNDWIGPIGRVGIGILCGGILVGVAHKLRKSYSGFSSVLVGGGMAVFYFTIALAYHNFHLFSQTASFIIMVVITAFAVVLSLLYNRQELAIISLVGGFAAPFMVSNGSGNYQSLFIYLIVLNVGLLIMAYSKAWRLLNLLCFIFTVIIFSGWLLNIAYGQALAYRNGFIFAIIFYLLFFIINIANNIRENKKFIASDFGILLANTSLFFGAGLYCISSMDAQQYKGLFSASMGVFNLAVSYILFRNRKVDTNILYLLIGITLTFVSLTAPLQLQGHYITLFWASECVLLFWLYQKSKISIFQLSSSIVWVAMLISLLMDWGNVYNNATLPVTIIFNKAFITSVYAAVASYLLFIFIKKQKETEEKSWLPPKVFRIAAIVLLFTGGALETWFQFTHFYPAISLNQLYLLLYSLVFVCITIFISNKFGLHRLLTTEIKSVLLSGCVLFYFLMLSTIYSIQEIILLKNQYNVHFIAHWTVAVLVGIVLYQIIFLLKNNKDTYNKSGLFTWVMCVVLTAWLSVEIHLIVNTIFYSPNNTLEILERVYVKTGLPILWGLCSFAFMWLGMKHKYKPLRIISLTLFSITLAKLFLFDISNIPVGGKIAAFFCLGVLLLVVSFMYQRLKKIISDDEEKTAA